MGGRIVAPWKLATGQASAHLAARCPSESTLYEIEGAPSLGCTIKGNVNGSRRIYHVQGQRTYVSAKMNSPRKRGSARRNKFKPQVATRAVLGLGQI